MQGGTMPGMWYTLSLFFSGGIRFIHAYSQSCSSCLAFIPFQHPCSSGSQISLPILCAVSLSFASHMASPAPVT